MDVGNLMGDCEMKPTFIPGVLDRVKRFVDEEFKGAFGVNIEGPQNAWLTKSSVQVIEAEMNSKEPSLLS